MRAPASLVIFVFHTLCYQPVASLTVLDRLIGIRLEALQKCWCVTLADWWRTIPCAIAFKPVLPFGKHSVVPVFCDLSFLMFGWVCQWKPFWIPVGESFEKAYLEEWTYMVDDSSDEQGLASFPALVQRPGNKGDLSKPKLPEEAPPAPRSAGQPDALPSEPTGPQGTAFF